MNLLFRIFPEKYYFNYLKDKFTIVLKQQSGAKRRDFGTKKSNVKYIDLI